MGGTSYYDPLNELFTANFEKPADLDEINLRALSSFQRALLVIDGTVTKFIEAVTMEPVENQLIDQAIQELKTDYQLLEVPSGTPVLARRVVLKGQYSRTLYAYASSLIVPERIGPDFKKKLDTPGESLGRILLHSRMEQYRELLWCGRERLTHLPETIKKYEDSDFLSRTYRISSGNRPIMLINEKFPLDESAIPLSH